MTGKTRQRIRITRQYSSEVMSVSDLKEAERLFARWIVRALAAENSPTLSPEVIRPLDSQDSGQPEERKDLA